MKLYIKPSKFKILGIFCLTIILTSCEGMRVSEGTVYDKSTNEPIDSVKCKVSETDDYVYTDSEGNYKLEGPFGSCMGGCKDMTIIFSKTGYKSTTKSNPEKENIYLEKWKC